MLGDQVRTHSPVDENVTLDVVADGTRLAAVRDLGLIDAERDVDLDRYTALVAELLGAPVSLITLVDRDRQFFASSHGLEEPWARARETPLSHSLCKYTIAAGRLFAVRDARSDARIAESLAPRDQSLVAYAGVPLVLSGGSAVGALCAVDHRPREWTSRELRILEDLGAAVRAMLELRRALRERSLHDALTGLPNRALMVAHAEQLARAEIDGCLLGLTVGLDGLGEVFDTYGAASGNRLISTVARRLGSALEPRDVLGRIDNDTFLILRSHAGSSADGLAMAHRLHDAVCAAPVSLHGDGLTVSATVGLASNAGGVAGETLVARAGESLRRARARRDRVGVADPDVRGERAARRRHLRGALAGAARRGEISVDFQPIVELSSGKVHGYEALARWSHPALGQVGPAEFIPLAETTGDVVRIGEHVLRTAVAQLAEWRAHDALGDLCVTVNISPVQLAVANIADVVAEILASTGLPGASLTLEITEGVVISPGATQRRSLEAIRELGVRLALDDFGTGYSTLSYLKRFRVDAIKIDRSFMDGLETDGRDAALMRAILQIGTGMNISVVAEGIETPAQRELLRLAGCGLGQGFLFAKPLPPERIRHAAARPQEPVRLAVR